MRKWFRLFIVAALIMTMGLGLEFNPIWAQVQNPPSNQSFVAGRFVARDYNYTPLRINSGGGAAGTTYSISLNAGYVALRDGRTIVPFSAGGITTSGQVQALPAIPISVGAGPAQETVTPTAVSGCYIGAPNNSCTITAAFTNAHGPGEVVSSGSVGIQEAINDAATFGGGMVVVDSSLNSVSGGYATVSADIAAALVMPNVSVEDDRGLAPQYWNPQDGATVLAAPTTLTAVTALPSTTPAGSYGTGTYHLCISYVDILGQEGPCSADFSEAGLASGSFIFSAPAASTGAVGYTIYISLTSGSYNLAYKVPITSTICTTTTLETTTAACAVTNSKYGQTGATATVTAITVSTSPIEPQVTVISTTSVYVPTAGGRTTVAYTPGSHMGTPGTIANALPFTITAAAATVVPAVLGTVNIAPGFMNYVGRTIEICGFATTTATAATIENIQFQWDSLGQNNAGKGVVIGNLTNTTTLATTGHIAFCQDFITTVAGATATAGSILPGFGVINTAGVDLASTTTAGTGTLTGAVASLNLAAEARINVIYLHTTATDGAGFILQNLTTKVVN